MSLNLVSPGVKVREVDLTLGRIDAVNEQTGAIAAPFVKGPVGVPVLIETEQDLLQTFGKPSDNDGQYEDWLTASSYLSYGGVLRVIRTDSTNLVNAHYPVSSPVTLKIENQDDYVNNHQSDSDWIWSSRDPGSWGNGLKVCTIDSAADWRLGIGTFGIQVGYAFTVGINTTYPTSAGTVATFDGFLKGVVTKVNANSVDVKMVNRYDNTSGTWTEIAASDYNSTLNLIPEFTTGGGYYQMFNSVGTATSLEKFRITNAGTIGVGQTVISVSGGLDLTSVQPNDLIQTLNSAYKARVVSVGGTNLVVDSAAPTSFASTSFVVTYTRSVVDNTQDKGEGLQVTATNFVLDWYDEQTLGLTNSIVYWKNISPKPGTTDYSQERSGSNDELHVVVVDDSGSVSGVSGNILEKYVGLSKASDGKTSPSENIYYKSYVSNNSRYVYAGTSDAVQGAKFTTDSGYVQASGGTIAWGQNASGVNFGVAGNKTYSLANGYDYSSASGGMAVTLADVVSAYEKFRNPSDVQINFLINGSSGGAGFFESQAKANKLIDIVESRKDCIACISPHKSGVVNVTDPDTQTNNIISFFNGLTSSSYAVFDSGYKYMFDRFNNKFRYIPLNGDMAGIMARTSINNYPWFSPAGASRGVINNAIKLAYNPSQTQRDLLYPKRINPVIFSPGAGIILFGDKTALARASAFDRINVRRLFLTLEATIEQAARAQLFEFNDVITRSNFLNIVEPYLRDVKAKRGITDFLVVCDESNNTPDVIDANQFRADIFVKPARSINFIGLTFVANRTGVSFEEVVGTV